MRLCYWWGIFTNHKAYENRGLYWYPTGDSPISAAEILSNDNIGTTRGEIG